MSLFAPLSHRTKFWFFFVLLVGGACAVFYWLANRSGNVSPSVQNIDVETLPRREALLHDLDELAEKKGSPQNGFGMQAAELDAMEREMRPSEQSVESQIQEIDGKR